MTKPTALQWLPQPSTVIGLGTLAGTFCYWITRDPIWAGVAAAAVKLLVPDNSTGGDRAFEAIACWRGAPAGLSKRRQSNRRLPPAPAKNQAPLYREAREKMTNDLISDQG